MRIEIDRFFEDFKKKYDPKTTKNSKVPPSNATLEKCTLHGDTAIKNEAARATFSSLNNFRLNKYVPNTQNMPRINAGILTKLSTGPNILNNGADRYIYNGGL